MQDRLVVSIWCIPRGSGRGTAEDLQRLGLAETIGTGDEHVECGMSTNCVDWVRRQLQVGPLNLLAKMDKDTVC